MGKKQSKPKGGDQGLVKIKVLFMGDRSIGKTSLLNRFIKGEFSESIESTQDPHNEKKKITVGKREVEFEITDLPEVDDGMTSSQFTGVKVAIGLLDVTKPETKENVRNFLGMATRLNNYDNFMKVICALKCDEEAKVTDEELTDMVDKLQAAKFYKTSAKSGEGVEQMFVDIAKAFL